MGRRSLRLSLSLIVAVAMLLTLALSGVSIGAAAAAPVALADTSAGQVIVRFRVDPGSVQSAVALANALLDGAVTSADPLGLSGMYRLTLGSGVEAGTAVDRLSRSPDVVDAELNGTMSSVASPGRLQDESGSAAGNWGLSKVDAARAWPLANGTSIVVAVLDSGVSASHPDLAGRVLPGWNVISNTADTADDSGHGTFVAGIIAGRQGGRVTGVAPGVSILPVKVLNSQNVGSTASFVAGIVYAVDHGARVINISADGISNSPALLDALAYAESHQVVVVAASGNSPDGQYTYPASLPTVLAVGASAPDDSVASFSSYGPFVDLAAPGVDVESSWWSAQGGNGYLTAGGTSAAAPFAAGAAALVLSADPGLSAAQVREILEESAVDIDAPGIDAHSGYGRLDAYLATRMAAPVSGASTGAVTMTGDGATRHLSFSAHGFEPNATADLWVTDARGRQVFRSVPVDAGGYLVADLGLTSRYPEGDLTVDAVDDSGAAATASYTVKVGPVAPAFQPIPPVPVAANVTYFPQTGHSLANGFKAYWESHGGLAVFGYPISEEFSERNPDTGQVVTVQYFERNRFEYHSDLAGTPNAIQLGRLGAELATQIYPTAPASVAATGGRYFAQTDHSLTGPFLDYWQANGGLAAFGYPLSEPFEEGGHLVQYFERARFEYHPELAGKYHVLLSRLGFDLARQSGYLR